MGPASRHYNKADHSHLTYLWFMAQFWIIHNPGIHKNTYTDKRTHLLTKNTSLHAQVNTNMHACTQADSSTHACRLKHSHIHAHDRTHHLKHQRSHTRDSTRNTRLTWARYIRGYKYIKLCGYKLGYIFTLPPSTSLPKSHNTAKQTVHKGVTELDTDWTLVNRWLSQEDNHDVASTAKCQ